MHTIRLRPILFILFVGFTALFLCIVTIAIYYYLSDLITEDTTERRLELMSEMKNQVSIRFRGVEETTRTVISHPTLLEAVSTPYDSLYEMIEGKRQAANLINLFLYTKPDLHSIRIYTDLFKEAPYNYWGDNVLPLTEFQWGASMEASSEDSLWVGSHLEPSQSKDPIEVVSYVHRLYNNLGQEVGYVELDLKETAFQMLSNVNPNQSRSLLMIMSKDNEEIMRLTPQEQEFALGEMLQQNPSQPSGYWSDTLEGEEFLILYASMGYRGMSIVELIPYAELYKLLDPMRRLMLWLSLLGIGLSIPAAYFLSKAITKPLARMLTGFKKVESGSFDNTLMSRSSIMEINQLHKGFNQMVSQLKRSIERLEEEHRLKTEAEINALQSQINPHFLYNTLDMVNWMAMERGHDDMTLILSKISRMYRISLSLGQSRIRLKEETEHALLYLQIQKARFKERFSFQLELDEAYSDVLVPKLLIQPFIENSIIHGFSQEAEGIAVHVRVAATDEHHLLIVIEDNGVGLTSEADASGGPPSHKVTGTSGYGIKNVKQRLGLYYGENYSLTIRNRSEGGVSVTIQIPIQYHQEVSDASDGTIHS